MVKPCGGHSAEEIERIALDLQQEYTRACAELEELYPGEDMERVDEIWNVRWDVWSEVLGTGGSRVVVGLCRQHALKVDLNGYSEAGRSVQNDREWAIWQKAESELKALLCPILEQGASQGVNWLLMARCQKIEKLVPETMQLAYRVRGINDMEDYREDLGGIGWLTDNWGVFEGRQVLLDYGDSEPDEVYMEPASKEV